MDLILRRKEHITFIQRPKLSKNMQFGGDVIYTAKKLRFNVPCNLNKLDFLLQDCHNISGHSILYICKVTNKLN